MGPKPVTNDMTRENEGQEIQSRRHTLAGTARVFVAEGLLIPTGLLTAAYLARRLGPEGYGLFTLASAIVAWVEWSLVMALSRASVRFVAAANDWRPIGATIATVHLMAGVGAALVVVAFAAPLAHLLGDATLTNSIRLFAADIPLFVLAQAHRHILVGVGRYSERALTAAVRWVSRLALVVVFVELGWSINGAILGSIGASALELAVARWYVRPVFSTRALSGLRDLWEFAAPLLLAAVALRLFDRLDLITLAAAGGTVRDSGYYGAAQNLATLPSLFSTAFTPLLLSSLSRAFRNSDAALARALARDALRGVLLILPFAGLVAGASPDIVDLVFGPSFRPAAPLLSVLVLGAVALVMHAVGTAALTAAGRPGLTLALTAPIPVVALAGYLVIIPQAGAAGAATVTALCAAAAAVATMVAVHKVCHAHVPIATLVRSVVVVGLSYGAAAMWPASGFAVVAKLSVLAMAVPLTLAVLGEFSAAELRAARSFVGKRA